MKNLSVCLLAIVSLGITSCSKEKNNNYVVATIKTVDADTDVGIPAEVKLEWRNEKDEEAGIQTVNFNNTNSAGILQIEEKLKGKPRYVQIKARPFDYYVPPYVNELHFDEQDIDMEETNILTFRFYPVYYYKFHFNSVDCFDETDSMRYTWIYRPTIGEFDQSEPVMLYGCVDQVMPAGPTYSDALYSYDDEVTLKYDIWRNGVHTSNTIVYENLAKATENLIEVEF